MALLENNNNNNQWTNLIQTQADEQGIHVNLLSHDISLIGK